MSKKHIIILVSLFSAYPLFSQINYSENFEKNQLTINLILGEDGVKYDNIGYGDLDSQEELGYPELPVKYVKLSVPTYADDFKIVENNIVTEEVNLNNYIYPVQYPIPTSIDFVKNEFAKPNKNIYESTGFYPQKAASIIERGYLDGDKQIITVAIYPVRYSPSGNKIEFLKNISFQISYSNFSTRSAGENKVVLSGRNRLDENILRSLKEIVANPQDIDKNVEDISRTKSLYSTRNISLPFYEYCVITTRELALAFERLTSWKRMKGINAGIICLEDILSDPNITGDLVSELYDDAGKIRGYLSYAYSEGTQYVLFGGNDRILPVRHGTGYNNEWGKEELEYKIPADLYFSDLNSNWNKDGDKYLGEPSDNLDYYPELYVGRVLCNNSREVDFFITKLLKYEQNPGNGDFSYLKKAFYAQADELQRDQQSQIVSSDLLTIHPEVTIYEESPSYNDPIPTFPFGKQVIDEVNNKYGFIGWFGHASPEAVNVSTGLNNKHSWRVVKSYEDFNPNYAIAEAGNGLDNIFNKDYPAISYSIGCDHTPFDTWNPNRQSTYVTHNFGESFTSRGLYGGPAFLGNTRVGWVSSSYKLMQKFAQRISSGYYKLGIAEALSKVDNNSSKHFLALSHNLIGCPEFEMWVKTPIYVSSNLAVQENTSIVNVNTENTDIAVTVNGIFSGKNYLEHKTGSSSFTNVPQNYTVMLHKQDNSGAYIPYISPIYAQNEKVTGFHYIHGSDVYFGKQVLPSKTTGDLIVKSGSEVVVEASGTVSLEAGFEVEAGAEFYIRK